MKSELFRLFLVILGAALMGATAVIVNELLGAAYSSWDAIGFAILGGLAFGVGAMRREGGAS